MTSKVVSLHSAAFFLERAREESQRGDVTRLLDTFQDALELEGANPSVQFNPDEIGVILRRGKVNEAHGMVKEACITNGKIKRRKLFERANRIRKDIGASYREIGLCNEETYQRMLRNTA